MICAIEQSGVCLYKALLYRSAVIGQDLARELQKIPAGEGLTTGDSVVIQFAWRSFNGQPVFYFGRLHGAWLGVSSASGFSEFSL